MMWVTLIQAVLQAVSAITSYLSNKKLIDAAQAEVIASGLKQTLDNMEKADHVKKELADNPDGDYARRLRDKYEDDDHQ